jgi:hypothetical protein
MLLRHDPIQAWVPYFGPQQFEGVVARDAQRAFQEWNGEEVVWLLPGLGKPYRWSQRGGTPTGIRCLALPADHLDRINVYHINPRGGVWGPNVERYFPVMSVEKMVPVWLAPGLVSPTYRLLGGPLPFLKPVVRRGRITTRRRDGAVAFERVEVLPDPGPIVKMTRDRPLRARRFRMQLTPDGAHVPSVSPDAESLAAYTPAPATWEGLPGVLGPDGRTYFRLLLHWRPPWGNLFSILDGHDPFVAQARMRMLIKQASNDDSRAAVIREAQAAAAPFISAGTSTRGLTHFWPTYMRVLATSDGPVGAFWDALRIRARTFEEARHDPSLSKTVPVIRVWGGTALLWILLAGIVHRGVRVCRRCKRLLTGTRRQLLCGPLDDPKCHRSWRAEAKRQQRPRREGSKPQPGGT